MEVDALVYGHRKSIKRLKFILKAPEDDSRSVLNYEWVPARMVMSFGEVNDGLSASRALSLSPYLSSCTGCKANNII